MCYVQSLCHVQLFLIPWAVCSPLGSSVHGIFQARILEWVAIFSSRGSSWPRDWTCFCVSCVFLCFLCVSCIGRQDSLPLVKMKMLFFFLYLSLQTCCIPKVRIALDHTVFHARVHFVTCWSWHLLGINKGWKNFAEPKIYANDIRPPKKGKND